RSCWPRGGVTGRDPADGRMSPRRLESHMLARKRARTSSPSAGAVVDGQASTATEGVQLIRPALWSPDAGTATPTAAYSQRGRSMRTLKPVRFLVPWYVRDIAGSFLPGPAE